MFLGLISYVKNTELEINYQIPYFIWILLLQQCCLMKIYCEPQMQATYVSFKFLVAPLQKVKINR